MLPVKEIETKIQTKRSRLKKIVQQKVQRKRGEKSIVQRWKTIKTLKEKFNTVRFWQKCFNFPKRSELYIRLMSRKINKPPVCAGSQSVPPLVKNIIDNWNNHLKNDILWLCKILWFMRYYFQAFFIFVLQSLNYFRLEANSHIYP